MQSFIVKAKTAGDEYVIQFGTQDHSALQPDTTVIVSSKTRDPVEATIRKRASLDPGKVWISIGLAHALNVEVGETISIQTD